MEKAWVALIIIGIITVAIVGPWLSTNLIKLSNFILGKGFTLDMKEITDQASDRFSYLKTILDNCASKQDNDCFCTNERILFPTDYRILVENDNNFKGKISLISNSKQQLNYFNLPIESCYMIKKISGTTLNNKLFLHYASKYEIELKNKKYEFSPDYVFYKTEGKLCIVDKAFLNTLNKDSICQN
ncbi:MAG: hypothetical protein AABW41_03160 [Nanoarchaeota archaeon]